MQLDTRNFQSINPKKLSEINEKLKRRYLDRLFEKIKILRKSVIERNWETLKRECIQIASTAPQYEFDVLATLARETHKSIPNGYIPRAMTPPLTKKHAEALIIKIDTLLMEHQFSRATTESFSYPTDTLNEPLKSFYNQNRTQPSSRTNRNQA